MSKLDSSVYRNGFHFVHERSLHKLPLCSIHLFCDVGSSFETDDLRGITHLLEHMLFQGTKKKDAYEIMREYDRIGAEFNAFTAKRFTCFYVKCHIDHAKRVIDLFTDIMKNSRLSEKRIEQEEQVVRQENHTRVNNFPITALDEFERSIYKNSSFEYPIDHVDYHKKKASIRDKLVKWYHWFYKPSNMVLSVVSNKKTDFWLKMLHKSDFTKPFESIKKPEYALSFPLTDNTDFDTEVVISHNKSANRDYIVIGFRTVNQYSEKKYIFNLLTHILNGMSGRLFKLLRQENNLVYGVQASTEEQEYTGYFSISTDVNKNDLKKVVTILIAMYEDIFKNGIQDEEFQTGLSRCRGMHDIDSEDSNTMSKYNGVEYLLYMREPDYPRERKKESFTSYEDLFEKHYENITLVQLNSAIQEYFRRQNMVLSIVSSNDVNLERVHKWTQTYLQ
jgi:predicted Zn-dependent peptidase